MKLVPEAVVYHRWQQYGPVIEDVKIIRLARFSDDGGSLTELVRLTDEGKFPSPGFSEFRVAQINYSTIEPGVIKAFHVHPDQRDVWFVPPEDRVLVVLVDTRAESKTARKVQKILLGDGGSTLLSIPNGVAHGCRNVGDKPARIVYMTDVHFSPEPGKTQEGRLPWDLVGAEIWEPAKE